MSIDRREIAAALIAPLMRLTGFRFGKEYRWGVRWYHRVVYANVATVSANYRAGMEGRLS